MSLWTWIKDVVAERGEADPIMIDLERVSEHEYAFRLGLRAGIGGLDTARVPLRRRPNPAPHPVLKEIHSCEIAGQALEAANPWALREKVARLLDTIAPARTLPLCYFHVPSMNYELPVYEDGGQFICPVLGGPRLKAKTIAGIRKNVCDYMCNAGYVNDVDDLEVGVVRPRDLRRVPPAAIFRAPDEPDLWLPSVEGVSVEGPVVGVLGHPHELRRGERRRAGAPVESRAPAAPDVIALLRYVRTEVERSRGHACDVYASDVRPEIWAAAEQRTDDAEASLVAYLSDEEDTRLELGIRRTGAGDVAVAFEDRCINVFLAPDADALAHCVGRYMASHDFLRFATEVEIHVARAPRAERLEADLIWTHGDGFAASANEPREVPSQWN